MGNCQKPNNKISNDDAEAIDSETEFNPNSAKYFRDGNAWTMAPYVEKSHFKLNKVIGIGTHGIVWLVERRKGFKI